MKTLEEKIRELPPELRQEVEDFVEFLLERKMKKAKELPKLRFRGALKELGLQSTSVELQHEILKWWQDGVSR
ncbi:DUF2281 domain-containing protein [Candidatus Caldatribacterium saccharofermentans]|uniref:DUF2281 domain-containing protein n=1 Tax=Candidatus Caldatribacterium saccharofermentans TaxID=1454753 RepID=A0A7V4WMG0_9BACT